mmetsp:Transcript_128695/g.181526  ORF Transcript_128695/g.181526 Transcript_128695/m.181526 type:complete len:180 (+) Transcript_128695:90-629(+)
METRARRRSSSEPGLRSSGPVIVGPQTYWNSGRSIREGAIQPRHCLKWSEAERVLHKSPPHPGPGNYDVKRPIGSMSAQSFPKAQRWARLPKRSPPSASTDGKDTKNPAVDSGSSTVGTLPRTLRPWQIDREESPGPVTYWSVARDNCNRSIPPKGGFKFADARRKGMGEGLGMGGVWF